MTVDFQSTALRTPRRTGEGCFSPGKWAIALNHELAGVFRPGMATRRDLLQDEDHVQAFLVEVLPARVFQRAGSTRTPFLLETSLPGVFVARDVRHGS